MKQILYIKYICSAAILYFSFFSLFFIFGNKLFGQEKLLFEPTIEVFIPKNITLDSALMNYEEHREKIFPAKKILRNFIKDNMKSSLPFDTVAYQNFIEISNSLPIFSIIGTSALLSGIELQLGRFAIFEPDYLIFKNPFITIKDSLITSTDSPSIKYAISIPNIKIEKVLEDSFKITFNTFLFDNEENIEVYNKTYTSIHYLGNGKKLPYQLGNEIYESTEVLYFKMYSRSKNYTLGKELQESRKLFVENFVDSLSSMPKSLHDIVKIDYPSTKNMLSFGLMNDKETIYYGILIDDFEIISDTVDTNFINKIKSKQLQYCILTAFFYKGIWYTNNININIGDPDKNMLGVSMAEFKKNRISDYLYYTIFEGYFEVRSTVKKKNFLEKLYLLRPLEKQNAYSDIEKENIGLPKIISYSLEERK